MGEVYNQMKGKYLISRGNIKVLTGLRVSEKALRLLDERIKREIKIIRTRAMANLRITIYPRDI
mgnify:CR=1 FL=1